MYFGLFGGGKQFHVRSARGAFAAEISPLHILVFPRQRIDFPMHRTPVPSFAVDRPRCGHHDFLYPMCGVGQYVEHERGPADIDVGIFPDLVHGLAGTGLSGEVDDSVRAVEGSKPVFAAGYGSVDESDFVFN